MRSGEAEAEGLKRQVLQLRAWLVHTASLGEAAKAIVSPSYGWIRTYSPSPRSDASMARPS